MYIYIYIYIYIWSRDGVTIDGFGLVIAYIECLQTVTTSNYSAVANSHTLQFNAARSKSSVIYVFTSRFLVTDSNDVLSFVLAFLTAGDSLTTTTYSSNCRLKTHS
jgi:hypothetical protein